MYIANELLQSTPARIQQNRTAEVTIRLVSASGTPLPKSHVDINLANHAFKFGSNAFGLCAIPDIELQQAYETRFTSIFNYATLPFYWGYYESKPGAYDTEHLMKMADWCRAHDIVVKGHPLIWHEVYPQWARNIPDEEILHLLQTRVRELPSLFQGRVGIWDVFNEATVAHLFDNAVGRWIKSDTAVSVVERALCWARESNPQAILLYNDFNISPEFEKLVADLLERGAPLDAIGIQSHMHQGTWTLERVWQVCETYARFGLPLHFTELTILSGRLKPKEETDWHAHHTDWKTTPKDEFSQAEYGEALYALIYSHPAVQAITWWDFADYHAWQDAPAGLLREDMSPKPLYERLHRLIREVWATHTQAVCDDQGMVNCRCTFGKHKVVVNVPSGDTLTGSLILEPNSKPLQDVMVS
jgi:endo-1,4-beta-xylanase